MQRSASIVISSLYYSEENDDDDCEGECDGRQLGDKTRQVVVDEARPDPQQGSIGAIGEVFICFGAEEYFDGHPTNGSDPANFDIIDHVLNIGELT